VPLMEAALGDAFGGLAAKNLGRRFQGDGADLGLELLVIGSGPLKGHGYTAGFRPA
jgi:hypothetical protein